MSTCRCLCQGQSTTQPPRQRRSLHVSRGEQSTWSTLHVDRLNFSLTAPHILWGKRRCKEDVMKTLDVNLCVYHHSIIQKGVRYKTDACASHMRLQVCHQTRFDCWWLRRTIDTRFVETRETRTRWINTVNVDVSEKSFDTDGHCFNPMYGEIKTLMCKWRQESKDEIA